MFNEILILGCGRIAEVLYLPYLTNLNTDLIAVEKNEETRQHMKSKFPKLKILENIPLSSKELPAAINLTPSPLHEETNRELLQKGWNIYSEKLVSENAGLWESLVDEAKFKKKVIVSAPVSADQATENQMASDFQQGIFGTITEIHGSFIGGGPARRGGVTAQRKWLLSSYKSLREDLAPYLLTPIIQTFGPFHKLKWHANQHRPEIKIFDSPNTFKSLSPTSEIGVGSINHALLTVHLAYRTRVADVVTKIEVIGTDKSKTYDLSEKMIEGKHPNNRVERALALLSQCMQHEIKWQKHQNLISNVLNLIEGSNP